MQTEAFHNIDTHPLSSHSFWKTLAGSAESVLLLDYDGTLAPFRTERDLAIPYPGIRQLIRDIRVETTTRVVVISGRAVDDLLPLLAVEPPPEIWGCHGWEHLLPTGEREAIDLPASARVGLEEARDWVIRHKLKARCEFKPASLALHWRGLPDAQLKSLRQLVDEPWRRIGSRYHLQLHPFDGGLELRPPGKNKGTAISSLIAQTAQDAPMAFLGDDLTDEDGFKSIKGRGLGILVRKEPRETAADFHLRPPGELTAFLQKWKDTAVKKGSR